MTRRPSLFRSILLLLTFSLVASIAAFAQETPPSEPDPVQPGPTEPAPTDPDQKSALEELLKTVEEAEGLSGESKRQLQERLIRLSERMNRLGDGIDEDEAIVAELEALRDDIPELTSLVDAILAAYEAGHGFDAIVATLIDPESGLELDDPELAKVAEVALKAELADEEMSELLAALQTEVEPTGELNRGQLVSIMAHVRNLQRKAERDGVELTDDQLAELLKEGLSGHLSDDEIEAITDAALSSDRGMSEAVARIKNAVGPKGKGRQNEQEPGDDSANVTAASKGNGGGKGNGNGNGNGPPAHAASKGKNK